MAEQVIKIMGKNGIHARPAGIFVKQANHFQSAVSLKFGDRKVNAKSIMNIMSLGLVHGSEVMLITEGPDEDKALDTLVNLVNSDFALEE